MDLRQLRYFVAVAHLLNFSRAAESLHISQSTLSAAIREVEGELNIKIFYRTNHGVRLTLAGVEFLPYAHQVLKASAFIENRYSAKMSGVSTRFSVSSQHNCLAAEALALLQRETDLPGYEFHYHELTTLNVISDVSEGKADVGVLCFNSEAADTIHDRARSNGVELYPIGEVDPYIFVRRDHPLTVNSELFFTFQQELFSPYPFIGYYQGSDGLIEFAEEFVDLTLPSRAPKNIFVSDRHAKTDLLLQTDGYTTGPSFFGRASGGQLARIPIINRSPMTLCFLRNPEHTMPKPGGSFIELLRQVLQQETTGRT